MKETPPLPLGRLIRILEEKGFSVHDEFPEGGPMSTERLLLSKDGVVVVVGSDRGFWYVAAAPAPMARPGHAVGFSLEKWKRALGDPGTGPLVEVDDYPLDEREIETYLERQSQEIIGMLDDMLNACKPNRVKRTWETLVMLAGGRG